MPQRTIERPPRIDPHDAHFRRATTEPFGPGPEDLTQKKIRNQNGQRLPVSILLHQHEKHRDHASRRSSVCDGTSFHSTTVGSLSWGPKPAKSEAATMLSGPGGLSGVLATSTHTERASAIFRHRVPGSDLPIALVDGESRRFAALRIAIHAFFRVAQFVTEADHPPMAMHPRSSFKDQPSYKNSLLAVIVNLGASRTTSSVSQSMIHLGETSPRTRP